MAGRGVAAQAVAPRPVIVRIGLLGGDLTMMRKISFGVGVFLMCLLLVLSPSVAFGEDRELEGGVGVGWAGEVEGGNYAVHARALNKYNAACWAMGVNPLTISTVKRSKLSDPNYGGDFYVYAQSFTNIIGWDDVPGWMPTYATLTFVMYGFDNQWASEVSKSLYDSAKADFKRVLAGEEVGGGGGSGGNVSGYTSFELLSGRPVLSGLTSNHYNDFMCNYYNAVVDSDGNVTLTGGQGTFSDVVGVPTYVSSVRLYVSPSVRSYVQSLGKEYCFCVGVRSFDNTVVAGFVCGDDLVISRHAHSAGSNLVRDYVEGSNLRVWESSPMSAYHDSSGVFVVMPDVVPSAVQSVSRWDPSFYSSFIAAPAEPDGDWPEPETPATPEPPEVPTPTAPTDVPDPTPTDPTVVWPTAPIIVNPPEVTVEVTPSGLDYTQLLTEINDNLLSIDSYTKAINSSLNSLRSDLVSGFDDVVSAIRNVYQYLQHLDSILEVHCKHIRDSIDQNVYELELYLKQLFEWLPKQLDFDANFDYDDSAVTTLLRSILNKIPGSNGNPNTFKPNPQADEPGFFDWLLDLWHRFLIDLVSVLPDELGGLVDAFSQLTHYFPFSIPWDLFALLALFEHEPVTPVFDIPWGFGGDDGQVQNVRIDLSCWDGVMAMVRPVFLVGFCFQLALITKDLLSGFDINKGGV